MPESQENIESGAESLETALEVHRKIQYTVLVDLFNKKLRRAMRPAREFSESLISFDPNTNESQCRSDRIIIGIKYLFPEGVPGRKLGILLMIVHEMAHFFSRGDSDGSLTSHGVSVYENNTTEVIPGEALNEAITELTATEIVREYIRQTGDRSYFYDGQDEDHLVATMALLAYPAPVEALGAVIKKISFAERVDDAAVWEALQHAYYNNDNVAIGDLYVALKKLLGKDVAKKMVRMSAEKMEDPTVRNDLLERLRSIEAGL